VKHRPDPTKNSIDRLCIRFGLAAGSGVQLGILLRMLTTDPLAPTKLRDPSRAVQDHLADSLVALEVEQVAAAERIADLGAGAGVPGLPLAIALPDAEVCLLESSGRKCEFITRAIQACELSNATAVPSRAEAWLEGLGGFDLVTARALGPLGVVAEYAAPLLRLGGALLVWRGRRDPDDESSGARAAGELGLEVLELRRVEPYPGAVHRHLQLMIKTSPTPSRFPRRPGMAGKRPLGAARGAV
jgi:16S rRNA (guanine527-N7)-methyltransferase